MIELASAVELVLSSHCKTVIIEPATEDAYIHALVQLVTGKQYTIDLTDGQMVVLQTDIVELIDRASMVDYRADCPVP